MEEDRHGQRQPGTRRAATKWRRFTLEGLKALPCQNRATNDRNGAFQEVEIRL